MDLTNRAISAARSLWYAHEKYRLEYVARRHEWEYAAYQRPLVSVLIPTHNRAKLLVERCLPSVLAQTYANLEIIVAAHGCTDLTSAVHGCGNGRIRVIGVPRVRTYRPTAENHWFAGPVAPLNAALKRATGLFLARIDDDDEWKPDHIEKALRFAQRHDFEFVSCAHEGTNGIVAPYNVDGIRVGGTQTWLWRSYLRFMKYNKDSWRNKHNKVNDTDLQQRFVNAGVRMGYSPHIGARVMPRPGETKIGLAAYRANREEIERKMAFN